MLISFALKDNDRNVEKENFYLSLFYFVNDLLIRRNNKLFLCVIDGFKEKNINNSS